MTKINLLLLNFLYHYHYQRDRRGDTWRILHTPTKGDVFAGDCDDFAITVAWHLADQSHLRLFLDLLLFRTVVWYVLSDRGNPHAVLWRRGRGWICNRYPVFKPTPLVKRKLFPFILPVVYYKLWLGRRESKYGVSP